MTVDRRTWISGTAASLAMSNGSFAASQAAAATRYDYLTLDIASGPPPHPRSAADAGPILRGILADSDAKPLGLFMPQLGWSSGQAAALLAWPSGRLTREKLLDRLAALPGTTTAVESLKPTARPMDGTVPGPGGIYVHRWFVIDTSGQDEFVSLSLEGWMDFEARFDAQVFGLFEADRSGADIQDGATRLLLLTRYKNHEVWEASRDPTTAAMKAFYRRRALTRRTWAASTLLTPFAT